MPEFWRVSWLVKVFVETTVLVSASVYAVSKDLEVNLIHSFYDISKKLMDTLKSRIREKVGVTTITVEHEAYAVIAKAVSDELEKDVKENPEKRDSLFRIHGLLCDICSDNLDKNIAILSREPIPEEEKERNFEMVEQMYDELKDSIKMSPEEYAKQLVRMYGPRKLKGTAYKIYYEQYEKATRQVRRLKDKPVSRTDKEILAEAIYVRSLYENEKFFFASTDYHFSPCKLPNGSESRAITDEIERRFNITCDLPDVIEKHLSKY